MNLTILLVLAFLFSLFFLPRWFIKSRRMNKQSNNLLPPSPPTLPLLGNLHQIGELMHHSLRDLSQKHGPVMLLYVGQVPFLVVSSRAMSEEVMKTHDVVFANRPALTAVKILVYDCVDVGFGPCNEKWRQLRKICVMELLSVAMRVKTFKQTREEEVACMVEKISRSASVGAPVNLTEMLMSVFMNILCRCVLGRKYDVERDEGYGYLIRVLTTETPPFVFGDVFPSLGWLDAITGSVRKLKLTASRIDSFLEQIIKEHEQHRKGHDVPDEEKDFVDLMLQVQVEENKRMKNDFTRDNMKALLVDLFFAGSATTSTVPEWAMSEMIKQPKILQKAQEEVRRVVAEKGKKKVEEEDIQEMNYLKCVVKETLRMHPPMPTLLPRQTSEGVKLGGYRIPAKTNVMVNVWAIQRDPDVWSRAEEFIPERFTSASPDFKGNDFEFVPFGAGRRICPGMGFGMAVVESKLANLLYWFDWELPGGAPKEGLDMTEQLGHVASRKTPLNVVAIPHFN
ncbi:hypothetical protein Syun_022025 [Stephania yunnanensis]|uniref:Cytochrome P450 n=1 Tax=Stephania yunnanensis TaxID=152371 RepID=A0AAP0IGV0_9MAGN